MATVVKFVKLPNQIKLPYVEQGDPSGVPLLPVHAIADSWRSFERVLPHLPPSIHAFALTQRGHAGPSRPPTGYRSSDFAADLEAFMDALEIQAAVIAGGSSGGLVAQRFAIDHPERTLGLVLIGSPLTLRGKPGMQELWDSTLSKLTDPIDPVVVREFAKSTLARPVPATFLEMLVQDNLQVPAFVWRATFEGLMQDDFLPELHRIKAPTLILWGDQDAILPRSDQERLAAAIPDARLVVYPGAGHTSSIGRSPSALRLTLQPLSSTSAIDMALGLPELCSKQVNLSPTKAPAQFREMAPWVEKTSLPCPFQTT